MFREIVAAGYPIVPNPTSFVPDITGLLLVNPGLADMRGKDLDVEGSSAWRMPARRFRNVARFRSRPAAPTLSSAGVGASRVG